VTAAPAPGRSRLLEPPVLPLRAVVHALPGYAEKKAQFLCPEAVRQTFHHATSLNGLPLYGGLENLARPHGHGGYAPHRAPAGVEPWDSDPALPALSLRPLVQVLAGDAEQGAQGACPERLCPRIKGSHGNPPAPLAAHLDNCARLEADGQNQPPPASTSPSGRTRYRPPRTRARSASENSRASHAPSSSNGWQRQMLW